MAGPDAPVPERGRGGWPLIGRGEELQAFTDALAEGLVQTVLVHGPAGVGKSRLAEEFLRIASSAGRTSARVTVSPGAATVPLGALAHLLPPEIHGGSYDPIALYREVSAALRERAGDRPFVLLVDDLPLLDATSQLLVGQLLDAGVILLIGTVRTGMALPDAVLALERRAEVMRFDLPTLSRDDVATLLHLALEAPVDAVALGHIWDASDGNALFVRELVLGARSAGNLVERRGAWSLAGPLVTTARLNELVEVRIGSLGGSARLALDCLALWEPLGVQVLESIAGADALEAVDRLDLVDVRLEGRRQQVSLGHPLFGEVLRGHLPPLRRRRLLLDGADRIEQHRARRREDPLRIATSRLDATGSADPALLVAAARLARYGADFPTMERLARKAFTAKATPEAALLLGDALHNLGGPTANEEADRILAVGQEIAGADESILVELTGLRCRNLMANLQRPDEALEVNRGIRARVTGDQGRDRLDSDRGLILCLSNRPLEGLEVLDGLADSADPRTRVQTASIRPNALILTGRCEAGLAASRQAFEEHRQLGDEVAIVSAGSHFINEAYALTEMGRFQEATDLGTFGYEAASKGGHRIGRYWFALGLGRTALLAGRARMARDRLAEAARLSEHDGSEAPGRVAFSLLAVVEAWLGDRDAAVDAVRTVDSLPRIAYLEAEQVVGPAWTAIVTGDTRHGRDLLLAAADRAAASGSSAPEAWLRHEVARLGDAGSVADRLEELAAVCEGRLVPAYGFHARAAVRQDPEQLEEASRRFEATGALLLAAEAATTAGRAHQRARTQKAATANFARAAALARMCEGARTPGLLTAAAVVPLTAREGEIARLAVSGTTSREIAERLYLSVRTVENHLQRAYTKLGVANRAELADALRTGTQGRTVGADLPAPRGSRRPRPSSSRP